MEAAPSSRRGSLHAIVTANINLQEIQRNAATLRMRLMRAMNVGSDLAICLL